MSHLKYILSITKVYMWGLYEHIVHTATDILLIISYRVHESNCGRFDKSFDCIKYVYTKRLRFYHLNDVLMR